MQFNDTSFVKKGCLTFSGIHLLVYLFYHLSYTCGIDSTEGYYLFLIHNEYLYPIWEMIYLSISAMILLFVYAYRDKKSALLSAIPLSLASVIHSLPYFYMEAISLGYDSIESLLISTVISVLIATFYYGATTGLFFIGLLPFRNTAKSDSQPLDLTVGGELLSTSYFNTSHPAVRAGFFISLTASAIPFAKEIFNTVDYMIDYGRDPRFNEILLIVWNYVYITVGILVTHAIFIWAKNKIVNSRIEMPNEE